MDSNQSRVFEEEWQRTSSATAVPAFASYQIADRSPASLASQAWPSICIIRPTYKGSFNVQFRPGA